MEKLNSKELKQLYINFTIYRDKICQGKSDVSVLQFFNKYGLNGYLLDGSNK